MIPYEDSALKITVNQISVPSIFSPNTYGFPITSIVYNMFSLEIEIIYSCCLFNLI